MSIGCGDWRLLVFCLFVHFTNVARASDEISLSYEQGVKFKILTDASNAKQYEGPLHHESATGGSMALSCMNAPQNIERVRRARQEAQNLNSPWGIVWVHGDWDRVIDPWKGDGRRVYSSQIVYPRRQEYIGETVKFIHSLSDLLLTGAQPIDSGVYACLMVTYSFDKVGYSPVDLGKAQLISVHILRVRPGNLVAGSCSKGGDDGETANVEDADRNSFLASREKYGSGSTNYQTGLEDWTTNVYRSPGGSSSGETLYKVKCETEVLLTALIMARVDPMFWSIGWRFVPSGSEDHASRVIYLNATKHRESETAIWSLKAATDGCHVEPTHVSDPGHVAFRPEGESCPKRLRARMYQTKSELSMAAGQAAKWWRATWLAVYADSGQGHHSQSGSWQCWVQGLVSLVIDNTTLDEDGNILGHKSHIVAYARWFLKEVYINEVDLPMGFQYWHTVHIWRILALIAAPLIVVLGGLILLIGTIAFLLYADSTASLKHKGLPPQYEQVTTLEVQKWKRKVVDPMNYIYQFLRRHGVKTYAEYDEESLY